ncbi:MAG: hypothetical protein IBX47_07710 [Desulfuromonadales bacterium]|nr:hypothetical protein [Desulfuromonadales bacterium]
MIIVFLTAPACLLSFVLALLCYRKAYYRHTMVLSLIALFMLVVTLGVIGFGYSAWSAIDTELALL